jgi:hypothetical protein
MSEIVHPVSRGTTMPLVTEERYWALFYMPLYTFIHNLLNVLVQTADRMGLQNKLLEDQKNRMFQSVATTAGRYTAPMLEAAFLHNFPNSDEHVTSGAAACSSGLMEGARC